MRTTSLRAERQIPNAEHGAPLSPGLSKFRRYMTDGAPGPHYYVVLLGLQSFDWQQLLRLVGKGLPYATLERFRESIAISQSAFLDWLELAPRTVMRRKEQGRLSPEESDRLLRAARIVGKALELFEGDREGAMEWLFTTQPALGGGLPAETARTDLGAREVENLIGRLEHGVYS